MNLFSKISSLDLIKASRPWTQGPLRVLFGIALTLGSVITLSELYALVLRHVGPDWAAAAIVNSLISITILLYFRGCVPIPVRPTLKCQTQPLARILNRKPLLCFLPAIFVAALAITAALISRLIGIAEPGDISGFQLAWITWIPVVEEITFRVGLGNFLRGRMEFWLGSYFSVLAFSVVHSLPTIERVTSLEISAPLGPLILAVFCELLYVYTGKIGPAIALHSACNATVVIFSLLDARWLDWLGLLYI